MKTMTFFASLICLCFCLGAQPGNVEKKPGSAVAPYTDVRGLNLRGQKLDLALIRTLWFNEKTVWDADDRLLAQSVMVQGKNPGLGVRSLHGRCRG